MIKFFFVRWLVLAVLYVFAAPVYLVRWILNTRKTLNRFRAVRDGVLRCPHCANVNSMNVLATCKRCGTTEFGSRLHCSNCKQTSKAFTCDFCTATIKVL
jgi:uncharacterized paraquat-inducible protein A